MLSIQLSVKLQLTISIRKFNAEVLSVELLRVCQSSACVCCVGSFVYLLTATLYRLFLEQKELYRDERVLNSDVDIDSCFIFDSRENVFILYIMLHISLFKLTIDHNI